MTRSQNLEIIYHFITSMGFLLAFNTSINDSSYISDNPCSSKTTVACQNGGRCYLTSPSEYICICVPGYEGTYCETQTEQFRSFKDWWMLVVILCVLAMLLFLLTLAFVFIAWYKRDQPYQKGI